MSDSLRIVSPYSVSSGYSKMGRAVLRTALLAGYNVSAIESDLMVKVTRMVQDGRVFFEPHLPKPIIPLPPDQEFELRQAQKVRLPDDTPTLLVQTPWNLPNWPQYGCGPLLGWTMTESDGLHPYWEHGLRNTDFVLAPSNYVLNTFRRVCAYVPSELLPIPVDERLWEPDEFKAEVRGAPPFLFLSVFNVCERKNWRTLIMAFAEEFKKESKEVGLLCKVDNPGSVRQLAECCEAMGAWVKVDSEKYTDYMMAALYRACDVYVCPSSEGFGLPVVEAAMCGKPSVTLDMGGTRDVASEETGYIVPSTMGPIFGHMPQWYDWRKDQFATCTVDDLRVALRRAYEEEKSGRGNGEGKGEEARRQALARFTPEAIAPKLRQMVEQGVAIHRSAVRAQEYPLRPRWATLSGNWGDVFCAIGNVREMMQERDISEVGIIFYGRDAKIAEWIRQQPWVREVITIIEPDKELMTLTYGRLCQVKPQYALAEWQRLIGQVGITISSEIAQTHLVLAEERQPKYWDGAVLPTSSHDWAESVLRDVQQPFLLVNPLSVASNTMADHWPYWGPSIQWLLDNATVPIVMVGENLIEWATHPKLVNVSGMSKSMTDVLALAEQAAGIITTGNNLGHYAIIAGKPGVVAFARTCPKRSFYHKFNEHPLLSLVEFEEPMVDFQTAVMERFGQYFGEREEIPHHEFDHPSEAEFYGEKNKVYA